MPVRKDVQSVPLCSVEECEAVRGQYPARLTCPAIAHGTARPSGAHHIGGAWCAGGLSGLAPASSLIVTP